MSRLFHSGPSPQDEQAAEALRIAFKDRYHHFKLLLNANNDALQKMADIEQALHRQQNFGMAFVRDRCTSVSVNVLRMIQSLDRLASAKYPALLSRFKEINEKIACILAVKKIPTEPMLVVPVSAMDRHSVDLVGNKMAMLGEIKNKLRLNVPDSFAITTYAYEYFIRATGLRDEINRLVQSANVEDVEGLYTLSVRIRQLIRQAELPSDFLKAIQEAWEVFSAGGRKDKAVAVRSSALGEDSEGSSYAGQYHSALNVGGEDIPETYKEVVASKYNLHAIIYRLHKGVRDEDVPMAVGCMEMIDAVAGGVLYSQNPVGGAHGDAVVINSVWGLPKTVVDGTAPSDSFIVSRTSPHAILQREIGSKDIKYVCCDTDSGLCREMVSASAATSPSLDDTQVVALARMALMLESYHNHPQDIEWAIDARGEIFVLQCRPLQQMKRTEQKPFVQTVPADVYPILAEGGVTVSPGAACGTVFPVEKQADALSFPKGAVLVARQALPAWASLLNRAAAVVTAQGGVAGHLASVAREFGIPALFALEDVMSRLHPGDQVTVDADNQKIYRGCVQSLLTEDKTAAPDITGSPVYNILKKASEWIVPLNLLDPDAREFAAENCQTFHDITRFIHEKSVMEMFSFGKNHSFPERSGKQLYYRVPMQWWVLNLDDGFTTEVTGKYVKLENIASVPMLAFWDGFAAVPWDGPPAIDGKGLMAVMFQSTTNPSLVTGVRTKYAEQNFFMISKNFCSLNSRLGYHFSTLETLVSDRKRENYISFQFKGGAADFHRRICRTVFIGEILEKYGFWVKIREDHLSARIQEESQAYIKARLAILGYLTLHTRQLDMIMGNGGQVAYYQSKLQRDIESHILTAF